MLARGVAAPAGASLAQQQQQRRQQQRAVGGRDQRRRGTSSGRATAVRVLAATASASGGSPYANGRLRFSKYQGLGNDFILVS